MNPFSKDYKPQVDLSDEARNRRTSQIRTRQRVEAMQSDDVQKRIAAAGNLGPLSVRGARRAIK